MSLKFLVYVTTVLAVFAYSNLNGYVWTSWLTGQGTANKSANHYHK